MGYKPTTFIYLLVLLVYDVILRDSFWKDWSSTLNTPRQSDLHDEKPITPYSILLVTTVTAEIPGTRTALALWLEARHLFQAILFRV